MKKNKVALKKALFQHGENAEIKCKELTDYIQQIINRNQREDFLRELLTVTVILEQEFYK